MPVTTKSESYKKEFDQVTGANVRTFELIDGIVGYCTEAQANALYRHYLAKKVEGRYLKVDWSPIQQSYYFLTGE